MKKLFSAIAILLVLTMLLTACGKPAAGTDPTDNGGNTTQTPTTDPTQTTHGDPEPTDPEPTDPEPTDPEPTDPEPTDPEPTDPEPTDPEPTDPEPTDPEPVEQQEIDVYIVGDSTVCAFSDSYYYPRYGYGTQLGNYLNEKVTVHNLALSGRSSKSFLTEANYTTLKNSLSEGDYLIISFGHNDQKSDDAARFTDASKPYTDSTSFGYHLYQYYVKLALDAGATPILCTPIVRANANDDYSGSTGHVTDCGDYRQAVLDLGKAMDVAVVDLTALTRARYEAIGYSEALYYHAVISGKRGSDGSAEPNWDTVDKTHLNIYGAKYVAYLLATELKDIDGIGGYVRSDISAPTKADLTVNPDYVLSDYTAPDLDNYSAPSHFATVSKGWYGTAFGNTGGNPQSAGNGYVAMEITEGTFQVGQSAGSNKGKFENSSDGFAFAFRQVEANKNFRLTVTATVITTASTKQAGFGLMLRDDVIIDQTASGTVSTNYVAAGILATSDSEMCILFDRENSKLNKSSNKVSGLYAEGDTATMTIERIGQSVTTTVVYKGVTYTDTYYDFDFLATDTGYMYIGMFANRGTVVEYTDVVFTDLGDSQGA